MSAEMMAHAMAQMEMLMRIVADGREVEVIVEDITIIEEAVDFAIAVLVQMFDIVITVLSAG